MENSNKIPLAIIAFCLIVITINGLYVKFQERANEKKQAQEEQVKPGARTSSGSNIYSTGGSEALDLIGTGIAFNGGVASTVPATIFQFTSSTDQLYWNTTSSQPALYGATTTAFIVMGNASYLSFDMFYSPATASSSATCEFTASNDSGCGYGDPNSNTSEWYPLPLQATTTPSDASATQATSSIVLGDVTTVGAVDDVKHSLTIKDVNYECARIQCYNSSTTDPSLLYVNARIR